MVSYTNFTTRYTKYLLGHSWVRDLVNNLLIDVTVWADKTSSMPNKLSTV